MNLIRNYIRHILLTEAAKTPADLGDMWVEIGFWPEDGVVATLWEHDRGLQGKTQPGRLGEVQAHWGGPPCSGAYEVAWATSKGAPGFGPMLYDIIMELVGDAGLMCDRTSVSPEAASVWEYYLNSRSDVVAKQLDDKYDPFLQDPGPNDPSDDCKQSTFRLKSGMKRLDYESNPEYKQKFLDHWSTKAYVKTTGTPILDELKSFGKVREK